MTPLPPMLEQALAGRSLLRNNNGRSGGEVLRVSDDAYLKYGVGRVAQDIIDEHARLRWLANRVVVPTVLHFETRADAAWLLTSAMPGRTAEAVLDAEPDTRVATVRALAHLLRRWHALPPGDCPFDAGAEVRLHAARLNVETGTVDEADFDDEHLGWTAERVLRKVEESLPLPFGRVVTHGDFSTGNVFIADGVATGCVDVGRAGVADPYQDLAILWNNLGDYGPELQDELLRAYGVAEPDMARLRFHLALDELF